VDVNQELIAVGLSNVVGSFFFCMPTMGSIGARYLLSAVCCMLSAVCCLLSPVCMPTMGSIGTDCKTTVTLL
jgi:MFS superfamily sulfate permease-like transporter